MSKPRDRRPETVLVLGGAIAMLSVFGQLFSLYQDSDLSTPIGRFRAMAEALVHFAPVLTASALLMWGTWDSESKDRRALVAGCVLLVIMICLLALPVVIPDAGKMSNWVIVSEVNRYRAQVVRSLLYLIGTIAILGTAVWKYLRRVPVSTGEAVAGKR